MLLRFSYVLAVHSFRRSAERNVARVAGFGAAVFNNCIDCVQNVFSKKLLSTHYNYINLQVCNGM